MHHAPLTALIGLVLAASPASEPTHIVDRLVHLGDTPKPEWKDFTSVQPEHSTLVEFSFVAIENRNELILALEAGGVGADWKVRLNNQDLGTLEKNEPLTVQYFKLTAAAVRSGTNRLVIVNDKGGDDIYVGRAAIHDRPLTELRGYGTVHAIVRDADSGERIPCRITLVRCSEKREKTKVKGPDGKERETEVPRTVEDLSDFETSASDDIAARKGVVYTKSGAISFNAAPDRYAIYASRGFEYSAPRVEFELGRLAERTIELTIRREVDTTGLLAADTHIHTKTHSGHGDINMEERVVAILGEGVEVAVATDHNHATDYEPTMKKLAVGDAFQSVVGDEVTTNELGHFNAFPLSTRESVPDSDHSDWVKLIQAMRSTHGVRAVILNHPRRNLGAKSPFDRIRLNPLTGEAHQGPADLGLDAIEIVNGKTLEDDRMVTVKDWFGLLNRGYRMKAVGGSDSHSVSEVVGQARTYVVSSSDDPRKLSIDEFCDNFLAGRLFVSLGLLATVEVDDRFRVGDLATGLGSEVSVHVRVQGPSWTQANSVALYLNGQEVKKVKAEAGKELPEGFTGQSPVKFEATWRIPRPPRDAFLVILASGPAVTAPFWPIAGGEKKYVLGATNPVWLDGDGDGRFTSAFDYAAEIASRCGARGRAAVEALAQHDASVATQFASIARAQIQKEAQEAYEKILLDADGKLDDFLRVDDAGMKERFTQYLQRAPRLEIRTRQELADEAKQREKEEEQRRKRREEEEKKRREEEKKRQDAEKSKAKAEAEKKGRV